MKCDDSLLIKEFYDLPIEKLMITKLWDMSIIQKNTPIENVLFFTFWHHLVIITMSLVFPNNIFMEHAVVQKM